MPRAKTKKAAEDDASTGCDDDCVEWWIWLAWRMVKLTCENVMHEGGWGVGMIWCHAFSFTCI